MNYLTIQKFSLNVYYLDPFYILSYPSEETIEKYPELANSPPPEKIFEDLGVPYEPGQLIRLRVVITDTIAMKCTAVESPTVRLAEIETAQSQALDMAAGVLNLRLASIKAHSNGSKGSTPPPDLIPGGADRPPANLPGPRRTP